MGMLKHKISNRKDVIIGPLNNLKGYDKKPYI